jgi:hypothetical protein
MLWKNRKYYSKQLLSLNSGVMDDNHDTYKKAAIAESNGNVPLEVKVSNSVP